MEGLIDAVFATQHIIAMVATWALIEVIKRLVPTMATSGWFKRLLPLMPLIFCSAAVWLPGVSMPMPWGSRVLLGIVLGSISGHVHKMARQTLLGATKAKMPAKGGS